jgi:transposase
MAVRGLGLSARFALTGGHRGYAPQAGPLIEDMPVKVVMADAAYDSGHLRQAIAEKEAVAVIPNHPSRALKHPIDKHLYAKRNFIECCFSKLSNSAEWPRPSKRRPATILPSSARRHRSVVALSVHSF